MEQDIAIYKTEGEIEVQIKFGEETVWATQRQIAELFDTTPQNITLHLKRFIQKKN